jgi:hypothetical protein
MKKMLAILSLFVMTQAHANDWPYGGVHNFEAPGSVEAAANERRQHIAGARAMCKQNIQTELNRIYNGNPPRMKLRLGVTNNAVGVNMCADLSDGSYITCVEMNSADQPFFVRWSRAIRGITSGCS